MKVITSFSYKGGAGRTVASANIAAALASEKGGAGEVKEPLNRKVALIDLDVFSAGTHRVFEISNETLTTEKLPRSLKGFCVQDYLLEEMKASDYVDRGGVTLADEEIMRAFLARGSAGYCRMDLTLFPATPDPDRKFVVQKYHENQLLGLLLELENRGYDYVVIDGESGVRSMADIAIRLADVVLMFFRLTWQHIEGSLNVAEAFQRKQHCPAFYLIPTCVPLVEPQDGVYQATAPGLGELARLRKRIPKDSFLDARADENRQTYGRFWAEDPNRPGRACIHDSLILKGGERILVYDHDALGDRAAKDYYRIAVEINRLHPPA
jgi:cellulose biosynthesis protein BcsQ